MFNEITIGPVTLHMYGLMIGLGFLAAYAMCYYRGKKMKMEKSGDILYGIFWCAIIGGLVGTRLLYYIVEIPEIIKDPSILWDFKNGYVVYGGIIGGILVSWLYCRIKKVSFIEYFDLVMPAVALAQGFGRIGCLLAGCCYGRETSGAFAITFQNSAYAPNGVPLIPTQLISSGLDFLHFAILLWFVKKWKKGDGQVTGLYFMLYSAGRFILEYFRGDLERGSVGVLSTSQFIAIFMFLFGAVFFFGFGRKRAKADEVKDE